MEAASSANNQASAHVPFQHKIAIVGGGPVGLSFALLLRENASNFDITIFERRWITNSESGKVEWCGRRESNNRRFQVVTIQSNVWSKLPVHVQNALFGQNGVGHNHVEMWPHGRDSPRNVGSPRNIPIKTFEDIMLQLIQEQEKVTLKSGVLADEDIDDYDFVVLADGGGRATEGRLFNGVFGASYERSQDNQRIPGTGPFVDFPPMDGHSTGQLTETVLGIYIEHPRGENAIGISEANGMVLTVAQNRFLLNPLGREKGYLNMWLTPDEAVQAVGLQRDGRGNISPVNCTQRSQCMWVANDEAPGGYSCATHGSSFWPAFVHSSGMGSPLWKRINEGLKLYDISPECVRAFTTFQLGPFRQRLQFYAKVRELYAFVLGDAAFNVSFRAGRGLNSGLKGAVSLATALTVATANNRQQLLDADFVEHNAFMLGLQDREVRIRTLQMMKTKDELGQTKTITNLIAQGLATDSSEVNNQQKELKKRLEGIATGIFTASRLPDGIQEPDLEALYRKIDEASPELVNVLAVSGAWNTRAVGGREPQPKTIDASKGRILI